MAQLVVAVSDDVIAQYDVGGLVSPVTSARARAQPRAYISGRLKAELEHSYWSRDRDHVTIYRCCSDDDDEQLHDKNIQRLIGPHTATHTHMNTTAQ